MTTDLPARVAELEKVAEAARRYRAEDSDDTPRIWKGKKLHDLAMKLDDALAALTGTGDDVLAAKIEAAQPQELPVTGGSYRVEMKPYPTRADVERNPAFWGAAAPQAVPEVEGLIKGAQEILNAPGRHLESTYRTLCRKLADALTAERLRAETAERERGEALASERLERNRANGWRSALAEARERVAACDDRLNEYEEQKQAIWSRLPLVEEALRSVAIRPTTGEWGKYHCAIRSVDIQPTTGQWGKYYCAICGAKSEKAYAGFTIKHKDDCLAAPAQQTQEDE
jgi:hypothetical protein